MTQKDIERLGWKYRKQGLGIVGMLLLLGLLAANIGFFDQLTVPIIVCAAYAMVLEMAEAMIWTRIAKTSAESLPQFFMAVSGVRLLSALAVMFVYYLAMNRASMLPFFLIFAMFYVAILLHHTLFFRKHSDISIDNKEI